MKKIISIVLCAVMLMSMMMLGVYANTYKLNEFEEFGQQKWVVEGKTENAPLADGIIEEGEYTLEVKDMDPYNDDADDRFYCIDPFALDVENFSLYFSYDDDYIYIGAEVTESETLDGEKIKFWVIYDYHNAHNNGIAVEYVYGGTPNTSEAEAFCTEQDGDTITYELIIRRTLLSDYIGADDVDDVKEFFLLMCLSDDRDIENAPDAWPEMWIGCRVPKGFEGIATSGETAEEEGKIYGTGPDRNRLPHTLVLGDAPETEPADTTPADTTPADTTPADTTPADTTPTESAPADTATPDAPAEEGGCGASVAAVAVALVAMLGTCTVFVNKRR